MLKVRIIPCLDVKNGRGELWRAVPWRCHRQAERSAAQAHGGASRDRRGEGAQALLRKSFDQGTVVEFTDDVRLYALRLEPAVEDATRGFLRVPHGELEDSGTVLLHVVEAFVDRVVRGRSTTAARGHAERFPAAAVADYTLSSTPARTSVDAVHAHGAHFGVARADASLIEDLEIMGTLDTFGREHVFGNLSDA